MQNSIGVSESGANGKDMTLAPTVKSTIDHAIAGVSREFHSFYEDVEGLTQSVASLTGEELASAKARLIKRIETAGEYFEGLGKSAAEQAHKRVDAGDAYVHASPWKMIGLGISVGLVLGFMLTRSN